MTPLEKKQSELIDVLYGQVVDLSMMSKIELGDDVASKIRILTKEIDIITKLEEHRSKINSSFKKLFPPQPQSKDQILKLVHDLKTILMNTQQYENAAHARDIERKLEEMVPFVDEVEEFNAVMGKPNMYVPNIPDEKEWMFVYNFILEELEEYKHACETGDIVEVLDALCDITYVSLGNGAMLHGLKDKVWPAYQEVQASNLSKACTSEEEAQTTVEVRSKEQGEPCHYEKVGSYYIVYRTRDRKVMKSCFYKRPNLIQFFTKNEIKSCKK